MEVVVAEEIMQVEVVMLEVHHLILLVRVRVEVELVAITTEERLEPLVQSI